MELDIPLTRIHRLGSDEDIADHILHLTEYLKARGFVQANELVEKAYQNIRATLNREILARRKQHQKPGRSNSNKNSRSSGRHSRTARTTQTVKSLKASLGVD